MAYRLGRRDTAGYVGAIDAEDHDELTANRVNVGALEAERSATRVLTRL